MPGTSFAAATGSTCVALHSALLARRLFVVVALPLLLLPLASYFNPSTAEMVTTAADGDSGSGHDVLTYEPFGLQASTASGLSVSCPHIYARAARPAGDQP